MCVHKKVYSPHRRMVQDRVPEATEEGLSPGGEQQRVCRRLGGKDQGFGVSCGTRGAPEPR